MASSLSSRSAWQLALPALTLLAGAAHWPTWAQSGAEDAATGMTPQLREVVVSSRRSLEDRFFATGSLVVVDRRDIEDMGVETVGDVLRQLPGVQVTPNANGSVDIRMRGLDSSATRVLVDGQRQGGRAQLPIDQLPAEMIERIEVVRAPTAEFSGASGGTINFVLRQGSNKRETTVRLSNNHVWGRNGGGIFASRTGPVSRPSAETTAEQAPPAAWTYFMGLSGGDYLTGSDVQREQFTNGSLTRTQDAATRNRREEWTLLPRLNGRLSARDQLALRGNLTTSATRGRYDSQASDGESFEDSRLNKQSWLAAGDWTRRLEGVKLESSASVSRVEETVNRQGLSRSSSGSVATTLIDERDENLWSIKTKLTGTKSSLLWMAGAELENRSASVDTRGSNGAQQLGADTLRHVLWGQNEWGLPLETILTAGLRAESQQLSTQGALADATRRLNFLQPSLHTRTPLGENLQLRTNLSRITRNPSIWDLVDRSVPSQGENSINNADQVGNPQLRPEVTQTLDMGLERRLPRQGQLGLNVFVRRIQDVTALRSNFDNNRWTEQRQNIGDALSWGLETDVKMPLAELGWSWARDLNLSASAALLQSRMTSGPDEGLRIPGQARYTASASVNKPFRRNGGAFGGVTLSMTGASSLSTAELSGRQQARTTVDVYVGHVIAGLGYWRVGIYNLGDAPFRRERGYTDRQTGDSVFNRSDMTLTPRVFMSVGTQF